MTDHDTLKWLFSDDTEAQLLNRANIISTGKENREHRKELFQVHGECHKRIKEYLKNRHVEYNFDDTGIIIEMTYTGKTYLSGNNFNSG